MTRLALPGSAAAALVLLVLPVAAAGTPTAPAERVPQDLPGDTAALGSRLGNVSEAQDLEAARNEAAAAESLAEDLLPHLRDLQGDDRAGDLVAELWSSLDRALREGNLSDARSLAASANDTLEDDLRPRVDAWARNGTAVTAGEPVAAEGEGFRLPIVVLDPPPGGIGALDAGIEVDPDRVRPTAARIEAGQGEVDVDPANGTARAASFQARSLAGLGSAGPRAATFAVVDVTPEAAVEGATVDVAVTLHAAADAQGSPTPVLALDGAAVVPPSDDGLLPWIPSSWAGLGAVGLLGAGAAAGARRLEV